MNIGQTLYVKTPAQWRAWLKKHYQSAPEIWLVSYKKDTGKPRVEYNDAVEEALCFGWIDSTLKKLDEERFAIRFSPRQSKGPYSQSNIERMRKLIKAGKVLPEIEAAYRTTTHN